MSNEVSPSHANIVWFKTCHPASGWWFWSKRGGFFWSARGIYLYRECQREGKKSLSLSLVGGLFNFLICMASLEILPFNRIIMYNSLYREGRSFYELEGKAKFIEKSEHQGKKSDRDFKILIFFEKILYQGLNNHLWGGGRILLEGKRQKQWGKVSMTGATVLPSLSLSFLLHPHCPPCCGGKEEGSPEGEHWALEGLGLPPLSFSSSTRSFSPLPPPSCKAASPFSAANLFPSFVPHFAPEWRPLVAYNILSVFILSS